MVPKLGFNFNYRNFYLDNHDLRNIFGRDYWKSWEAAARCAAAYLYAGLNAREALKNTKLRYTYIGVNIETPIVSFKEFEIQYGGTRYRYRLENYDL